ncbi:ROK family protein [Candidatus Thiosymbion oneisti]|uniref:ROK family protein n=1 Tax=Candidatus Thiosymbion oneisti TaxID=589554 RepID=UPI000AAFC990|nr:ROK family protein [Candidatus Thiosymbion oneisti]
MSEIRIGIDLGGTKTEVIALDADQGVRARHRMQTPRNDYAGTLRTIGELVAKVESETGARGTVGVGIPGSLSPFTGRMRNANSVWLNGKHLDVDLAEMLGRPVRLANDADCFALSEAVDGAGSGVGTVFGVIIGTGTGGGIVVNGRLLTGPNRIAGEWGHNPLPWPRDDELPGPPCHCGKRGCIETFLSGPGLAGDLLRTTGRHLTPPQIVAAAHDPEAEAALRRYEDRMARALASVVNLLDPDVIVLGGGLSNLDRLYREVPKLIGRYLFSDGTHIDLRPPVHGDSSGVRGAAWLWVSRPARL